MSKNATNSTSDTESRVTYDKYANLGVQLFNALQRIDLSKKAGALDGIK